MRLFARILSILLIIIFFTSNLLLPVFAADNQNTTTPIVMPQTDQGVSNDVHTLTQHIILGMISFTTCALGGIDITYTNHKCLGYDVKTGKLGYVNNSLGITGLLINGIAFTFQKPLGTSDYLKYLSSNFGIVKQTYAANQGFDQLSPLMDLWIGMRNVSYVLFVLIFVIVGFAIMLRAKIDPRTAMTIENQIPKLIIALLLISFSYAIAGFLVDLMWLLIFIIINLLTSLDKTGFSNQLIGSVTGGVAGNPFDYANSTMGAGGFLGIATNAATAIKDVSDKISIAVFQSVAGIVLKVILTILHPENLGICIGQNFLNWGNIGACLDGRYADQASTTGSAIAFIIFTIAIIVALGKLWWQLIKAYALFIIYVVFAAPMIMLGVLPGSKINFENWLRHIAAYLFVFPTAVAILLFGRVIMDAFGRGGFTPPLLGIPPTSTQALGPILGFAIIMLLPQALTIVQDALQAPDLKYLPGIGAMMAAGTTATTTLINKPWQRLTRKANTMEGLDEGPLRKLILGGAGSRRRLLLGDTGGK